MSNVEAALKYAAQRMDEEHRKIEVDLAMGRVKDFSDYKFSCGVARGYLFAKSILLEVLEKAEGDDE